MIKLFPLILLACIQYGISDDDYHTNYYSFGPMLHWNFGAGKCAFSVAIEGAFWSIGRPHFVTSAEGKTTNDERPSRGVDFGVEYELAPKSGYGIWRLYGEGQIATSEIAGAGVSLGPVLELTKGKTPTLGIQASQWFVLFLGADLRERYLDNHFFLAPGCFGKFFYRPGESPGKI